MDGIVYKITNKINNKIYIGQTRCKLSKRWSQHKNLTSPGCPMLKQAFLKYGIDSFEISIICRADNRIDLNNREKLCIRLYKSIAPKGYNLAAGGESRTTHPDTRRKMSLALTGKKRSPESIKRMSECKKGIKLTEHTKQKMSMAKRGIARPQWVRDKISKSSKGIGGYMSGKTGEKHPRSQPIVCLNDNLKYVSMNAAAIFYQVGAGLITQQIQGSIETVKGLRFQRVKNGKDGEKTKESKEITKNFV